MLVLVLFMSDRALKILKLDLIGLMLYLYLASLPSELIFAVTWHSQALLVLVVLSLYLTYLVRINTFKIILFVINHGMFIKLPVVAVVLKNVVVEALRVPELLLRLLGRVINRVRELRNLIAMILYLHFVCLLFFFDLVVEFLMVLFRLRH